ncbi:Maf family protein [Aliikangiella sp. IMCC44359]|uniref:Maf family protein n=1 Tax=Aliikangiella sp. IMCC44359 TaxID=3459125 RepID=UPI00403AE8F3
MKIDIILASGSQYRANLLKQLQIPFRCISPNINETQFIDEPPYEYVKRLSLEKANNVAKKNTGSWVIGSDQIALFQNKVLGKPLTKAKAISQLSQFSGNHVEFLTGVSLIHNTHKIFLYEESKTDVFFKHLSIKQIDRYLDKDMPYDCAGSFKIESCGSLLFDKVVSEDPSSLIGLPLIIVTKLFDKAGIDLLHVD